MMKPPDALVQFSRIVGSEVPLWTQGTGGNVSVKDGDTLWIKRTGTRLGSLTLDEMAKVSVSGMRGELVKLAEQPADLRESFYAAGVARQTISGSGLGRPSMESGFHAALKAKWVVHVHSLPAILLGEVWARDQKRVEIWSRKRKLPFVVLPALLPGCELSWEIHSRQEERHLILQNHGLILQAEGDAELLNTINLWKRLEGDFCSDFKFDRLEHLINFPGVATMDAEEGTLDGKLYFPDAWVFRERIQKQIGPAPRPVDADAAEIWQALRLLSLDCPDLAEFPHEKGIKLTGLPLEQFRKERVR